MKRKEEPSYKGTFTSAKRYVLHTFATTAERVDEEARRRSTWSSTECPLCHGKAAAAASRCRSSSRVSTSPTCRALPLQAARRVAAALRERHARRAARSMAASIRRRPSSAQRIAAGLRRAARRPARSRARLPVARAQHADAVAGRAAAAAPRDAGALESVRRRLRARRAVGRTASGGHRSAARGARSAEGVGQFAVRRRARARRHPPRDWIVDVGPAAGEHGGRSSLQRTAGGLERRRGSRRRDAICSRTSAPRAARTPREPKGWLRARAA